MSLLLKVQEKQKGVKEKEKMLLEKEDETSVKINKYMML